MKGKIRVIITDYKNQDFLKEKDTLIFHEDQKGYKGEEYALFNVYDQVRYQKIIGFGGAMTQASAVNLMKMSEEDRRSVLRGYFDPIDGLGYSLCRTTINSCDFSTEFYSYDDINEDWKLENFSIEHDMRDVIPMLKEAMKINGGLKLFSSPWSPPAWMKTNGRMDKGRYLRKECYQVWADYMVRFIQEYEKAGIPIWGLTIQNEAKAEMGWESCCYTSQDEQEFARDYLRPALNKAGLTDKKVLFWDHNKERAVDRALDIFSDPAAKNALDGVAVHWYAGDHFGALDAFHRLYPDKVILGTEACVGQAEKTCYDTGERYAHDIIGDLNHWAGGWVDWNMVLDSNGAPDHWKDEQTAFKARFEKDGCNENDLNEMEKEFLLSCMKTGIWVGEAPVIMDCRTKEISHSSSYYYIGHFSKFIRPGAVRIGSSIYTDRLEACAFENPDGGKVAVVMNAGDEDRSVTIRYRNELAETQLPAHSIATYLF